MSRYKKIKRASTFAVLGGLLCAVAYGTSIFYQVIGLHAVNEAYREIHIPQVRNEFGHKPVPKYKMRRIDL